MGDGVKVGGLVGADEGHIWRSRVSSVDGIGFGVLDEDGLVKNLIIWQQQSMTRVDGIKVMKILKLDENKAWLAGGRVYIHNPHFECSLPASLIPSAPSTAIYAPPLLPGWEAPLDAAGRTGEPPFTR